MKKLISAVIAIIMIIYAIPLSSSAVTGETSSATTEIFPGVTSTHVVTGSGTKYGLNDMTIVEFDPGQEGLSVNVTTGYNDLNRLSTISNTVSRWDAANPDKTPIVAINGDWFTVGYDDYSTAMTKKQLNIPLGFNMHGGEIITTQQTAVETPNSGYAPSFGIAADGTPLIGCIDTTVEIQTGSARIYPDGINRLPADNAIIMYTDRGPASNYCLDDAYEVYIDFDHDVAVKDGFLEASTVAAVSGPGEARLPMQSNRIILTARGTRISELESLTVGKRLRIKVTISDRYGNTDKWKTVTDCVGGHHEICRNGTYFQIGDSTRYPANVIGITAEGKVIFLCNDGRQSGYSLGVPINKMPDLARELGIVSGIYMDGGGSTTMLQRLSGSMQLVNRPCNTNHAQRTVSNAVILACDVPNTDDLTFDSPIYNLMIGGANNLTASLTDSGLLLMTDVAYDPFLNLTNFSFSADDHKYLVLDAKTTYKVTNGNQKISLYLAAGSTTGATESCKTTFNLPETGKSEKVLVDLSNLSLWNGKVNSIRVDIFDNFSGNEAGKGIYIREMKFFGTRAEAEAFIAASAVNPGDADGDGSYTARDVDVFKTFLAGGSSSDLVVANCDLDGDGSYTARDLDMMKSLLAS